ncbi:hypothetical protein AUJ68_03355 [Candidatus Woesearchaeota archaeon CG1_02_57_44]|nr:MAG: hypothetical protein AUJ68_03355 [Candidatus Woesearchaeota archaeon CG1_02_57_44]PIN70889.1 MAG: hypothetical protein COV94_00750 [Candidatus Woesearchaeota archaeon CG11_big_fil_rev_8_21_14_0_20_57_5]
MNTGKTRPQVSARGAEPMASEEDSPDAQVTQWISRLEGIKNEADLSQDEDLSFAIMNLVSLEEHLCFTAVKVDSEEHLTMLDGVRKLRVQLLRKMVKEPKGEEWCISKHLLAASMRLSEVGTKELSAHGEGAAMPYFRSAFELWSLFFAINLKGAMDSSPPDALQAALAPQQDAQERANDNRSRSKKQGSAGSDKPIASADDALSEPSQPRGLSRIAQVMKELVNCCREW